MVTVSLPHRVTSWLVTPAAVALLAFASPASADERLSDLFEHVRTSVVTVHVVNSLRTSFVDEAGGMVTTPEPSIGSGVLMSQDGKVLTAAHVVDGGGIIHVEFNDGLIVEARVLAWDSGSDLALLELQKLPENARPAPLADSDRVMVGEEVFIVGAPYGLTQTLTVGHVGSRHQMMEEGSQGSFAPRELFQTDAAVNPGASGAPMFNMKGEVIGIMSRILSRSGGFEGIGFAVTSNTARDLAFGPPSVWSGMDEQLLTGDLARAFNIPQAQGILVQRVAQGSIAEQIGVRPGTLEVMIGDRKVLIGGDIILEVGGIAISERDAYEKIDAQLRESVLTADAVSVKVLRAGRVVDLPLPTRFLAGSIPDSPSAAPQPEAGASPERSSKSPGPGV